MSLRNCLFLRKQVVVNSIYGRGENLSFRFFIIYQIDRNVERYRTTVGQVNGRDHFLI
jgi:hypothetical protein